MKDSSQAASFEQKDPLVVYKMEAFNLFEEVVGKMNEEVCSYLMQGRVVLQEDNVREAKEQKTDLSNIQTSRQEAAAKAAAQQAGGGSRQVETFVREGEKVGRNDLCPCGSGKKYKHCHGK